MTRFLAIFKGEIQPAAQPAEVTKGHFDWLRDNADRITDFGGLRLAPDSPFVGAAWIIQAESEAQARQLIAGDPYSSAGLWGSVELYIWNAPKAASTTPIQTNE